MRFYRFNIFIVFCCLAWSVAAQAQFNIQDSIQTILQKDTANVQTRFNKAYLVLYSNASPKEAERLGMEILYPFAQANLPEKSEQLTQLARIYLMVYVAHRERGDENRKKQEFLYLEKALETAQKAKNDEFCARTLNALAYTELERGDMVRGHEYLYEAIEYYDKAKMYVKSTEILYIIAGKFFEIKDLQGMNRALEQMELYFDKDTSKQSEYQYNVIKHSYFELTLEKQKKDDKPVDYKLVDSLLFYIQKNIYLTENHLSALSRYWLHGYAYYFVSRALDNFYPEQTDSILLYLDKAQKMNEFEVYPRTNQKGSGEELQASVDILRAKSLSRQGKWQEAHQIMLEAVKLIDWLKPYRKLTDQKRAAFQFMIDYYEKTKQFDKAFLYQKRFNENEAEIHENDKLLAMNEMSAKYETEKKELQIQTLAKEKIAVRRGFIVLTVGLLIIIILLILFGRLRRKNIEQRLYETALLAELSQNELLTLKNSQVQAGKQQLQSYRVQNSIESIVQLVSESLIETDTKKIYLERLLKLDPQSIENVYLNNNLKITAMDMKYLICFAAELDKKDISLIFNVEPASVNTVRYRIRKKYNNPLPLVGVFE